MEVIFQPLEFRNLTVKNRMFHSNVSGRFDNYDGSGNSVRINWELKFARSGVGAIISSFVPVRIRGRIVPSKVKISVNDDNNALLPWEGKGNTTRDSLVVCRWLETAGVDAIHVSRGSLFPHPHNPAGDFPVDDLAQTYDTMASNGRERSDGCSGPRKS
jgi:2,4-dienoyl-CoA reductase-like NADH-dependent reductase (Old Yellow Enzyme family)